MTEADGLSMLEEGPGNDAEEAPVERVEPEMPESICLWAVRLEDTVYAYKNCPFGQSRAAKEIKHTNLTGGGVAFSAGELIFVDSATLIVNGDSGRYGPRSEAEMIDVARAFRNSGYIVYSRGWDHESGKPFPFVAGLWAQRI